MTTEADLLALASELEAAGEGSRELDIKIALVAEPYPRRNSRLQAEPEPDPARIGFRHKRYFDVELPAAVARGFEPARQGQEVGLCRHRRTPYQADP